MAALNCSITLGDGPEPVHTTLLPIRLPAGAGILIRRQAGWHRAVRPGHRPLVQQRSLAAVGHTPGLSFVEVHPSRVVRTALGLAAASHVLSVTVCPAGVSPQQSALALAVADLLRTPRGVPIVTCAVCPPIGDQKSAIPHEVEVTIGGRAQHRIVWQLIGWDHLPNWLESLGRSAVAA